MLWKNVPPGKNSVQKAACFHYVTEHQVSGDSEWSRGRDVAGKVLTAVSIVNEQCPSASVGCPVCSWDGSFLPICNEAAELGGAQGSPWYLPASGKGQGADLAWQEAGGAEDE